MKGKNKLTIRHDVLYEVDVTIHRKRIITHRKDRKLHPNVTRTEPDEIRITKRLRGKVTRGREIEIIGSLGQQVRQLKSVNDHHGQNILVTITPGEDAMISRVKPTEIYREVRKRQRPVMKIIPTKVANDAHLPTGTWKELGPEPPPRPTVNDLMTKINSLRNK